LKKGAAVKLDTAVINDLKEHLADVSSKIYYVRRNTKEMSKLLEKAQLVSAEKRAQIYYENLKPLMEHIRKHVDDLEKVVSDEHWDLPKYREMLFIK
jgi:glutamine synthetase